MLPEEHQFTSSALQKTPIHGKYCPKNTNSSKNNTSLKTKKKTNIENDYDTKSEKTENVND
jgi:hypothetical protein